MPNEINVDEAQSYRENEFFRQKCSLFLLLLLKINRMFILNVEIF
jgi:hypothetical protein